MEATVPSLASRRQVAKSRTGQGHVVDDGGRAWLGRRRLWRDEALRAALTDCPIEELSAGVDGAQIREGQPESIAKLDD